MSSFAGRIGPRLLDQLFGVLVPGLVVMCEVWLLWQWSAVGARDGPVATAADQTAGANSFVAALGILVFLFAAYTIGAFARQVVWWFWRGLMKGRPNAPGVYHDLLQVYGGDFVERALVDHGALRRTLSAQPGRRFDPLDGYVLSYCKLWLRSREPLLNVDHFEREINLLVSLFFPLWVATLFTLRAGGLWWFAGTLVLTVIATGFLITLIRFRQQDELFQAVKHFMFAQWFLETPLPGGPNAGGPGASRA